MKDFAPSAQAWINGSFAKFCVRCNSEEEQMAMHDQAVDLGLEVHLITDESKATSYCAIVQGGPIEVAVSDLKVAESLLSLMPESR